jgi:hypothetical protein
MKITVSYAGENYMTYELKAVLDKYTDIVCGCDERDKRYIYMTELRREISIWIGENADSATSPCDYCDTFRQGKCSVEKRERCDNYRFYRSVNTWAGQ